VCHGDTSAWLGVADLEAVKLIPNRLCAPSLALVSDGQNVRDFDSSFILAKNQTVKESEVIQSESREMHQ
jgi:hypothetical protein